MSGAILVPTRDADEPADSDRRLVVAVRQGDDRAFEVLYERYQRRIHAYVLGMVKDHGRAEDVTQEVFVSALRRMRETEQPLAFKPWLYQIAKNGCIDAFRRSKRAEEVSYDADDALAPADHSKLVGAGPSPDAAVAAKEDLDNLCGAFGGLSETHHEILVLRELEGLSYQEIGTRMGMSRPAVESTLFRARRRLTEEYDDIVSGARCLRVQQIIATAVESRLGTRDTRRLARHLSHCQPCRREALAAGVDRDLFTRPSVRERVANRVAGILPLPAFLKLRRAGTGDPAAALPQPGRWSAHLPMLSDQLSSGWGKAAAGAALVAAGVGGAAGVHQVTTPHSSAGSDRPALVAPARSSSSSSAAPATPSATAAPQRRAATHDAGDAKRTRAEKPTAKRERTGGSRSSAKLSEGSGAPAADRPASSDGGGSVQSPSGSNPDSASGAGGSGGGSGSASSDGASGGSGSHAGSGGGGTTSGGGSSTGGGGSGSGPVPSTPTPPADATAGTPAAGVVPAVTDTVDQTVDQTTDAVQGVTQQTTQTVDDTVHTVTGGGPVSDAVDGLTDTVDSTVDHVGQILDDTVGGLTGALGGGRGR